MKATLIFLFVLSTQCLAAPPSDMDRYRLGIGERGTFSLPTGPDWKQDGCRPRTCSMYQSKAYRTAKKFGTFLPIIEVKVGGNGVFGQASLAGAPYSFCRWGGQSCSIVVNKGSEAKTFALKQHKGTDDMLEDVVGFVNFTNHAEKFSMTYMDERKKSVTVVFDHAQQE